MNSALLAKWSWRFGVEKTSWWRILIGVKCGFGASEWRAIWREGASGLSVWKWIVIESSCFWEFGYLDPGGGWVSFWSDVWSQRGCLSVQFPRIAAAARSPGARVCDYFSLLNRSRWRIPLRTDLRGGAEQERRRLMQLLEAEPTTVISEGPPCLVWPLESSGNFSVRSLARMLIKRRFPGCVSFPAEAVWLRHVPTKVSCLVWKVAHESLATVDKLRQRGFQMPNRCVLCFADCESIQHLFWRCPFASQVWSFFSSRLSLLGPFPLDAKGFLWAWKGLNCDACFAPCVRMLAHSVLWVLWSERNNRIFRDKIDELQAVIHRIVFWVGLWGSVGGLISPDILVRWQRVCGMQREPD
ncbi:Putative ribonuclease H protein At1g65750 [Linum perenne]